jgi:hypothetical protein
MLRPEARRMPATGKSGMGPSPGELHGLTRGPQRSNSQPASEPTRKTLLGVAFLATGVVFGDIGTSPLYAFRSLTLPQLLSFAVVAGMMALFVWSRLRYDLVAIIALLAALAVGIVPPEKAFVGFSADIIIIVASALVVSRAVARSGLVEQLMQKIGPKLTTTGLQVVVLAGIVSALSAFLKNIAALAMLMPVAFQLARRTGTAPSSLLMPMSFGALLGGLITLVGTSPNVIVSHVRADLLGQPFGMFDFAPVGVALAMAGVAYLAFGYRLLPTGRRARASLEAAFNIQGYTTEAIVPAGSPIVGKTVAEVEALAENNVEILSLIRRYWPRTAPDPDWVLQEQGCPSPQRRAVRAGAGGRASQAPAGVAARNSGSRGPVGRDRHHGGGGDRRVAAGQSIAGAGASL